uniref:Candidate secreted effector n=1 Tax=Meloidogyne incognita TaxID=6306 RepID=A0A914N1S9_MELIC
MIVHLHHRLHLPPFLLQFQIHMDMLIWEWMNMMLGKRMRFLVMTGINKFLIKVKKLCLHHREMLVEELLI